MGQHKQREIEGKEYSVRVSCSGKHSWHFLIQLFFTPCFLTYAGNLQCFVSIEEFFYFSVLKRKECS